MKRLDQKNNLAPGTDRAAGRGLNRTSVICAKSPHP